MVELGAVVQSGQPAGVIHCIDWPWQVPAAAFTGDGLVACLRAPMLTAPGDCLYKLLVDVEPVDQCKGAGSERS